MKKLIAILMVLAIVAGFAFAAEETGAQKDEIKVTAVVKAVTPQFKLYGSATSTTSSTGTGMTEADRVTTDATTTANVDGAENSLLADGGLTIYLVIKQTRESRWTGSVVLSVSATELTGTVGTGSEAKTYTTAAPTISALAAQHDIAAPTGDTVAVRTTTPGTASATVAYSGRAAAAADIASFSVNWPKSDVPPATYTGYIRMTYTAP